MWLSAPSPVLELHVENSLLLITTQFDVISTCVFEVKSSYLSVSCKEIKGLMEFFFSSNITLVTMLKLLHAISLTYFQDS